MTKAQHLISFGCEIEFEKPIRKRASVALSGAHGDIKYDVSAEGSAKIETFTGLSINGDTDYFSKTSTVCGGEYVSHIWNGNNDNEILNRLCAILTYMQLKGENNEGIRAGIHLHLSYPYNIPALINLVTVAGHLEKLFYWLGGMGRAHRGMLGDSIYFRPITDEGPIVVPTYNGWAQCFTIDSIQKSQSSSEFWQRYGDSNGSGGRAKAPVVRYHWINLLNLYKGYNTIELRVMNTSLDPMKTWAMLKLWMALGKYALIREPSDIVKDGVADSISVFDVTPDNPQELLVRFIRALSKCGIRLDATATTVLMDMLNAPEPILKRKYVRSHLHDRHSVPVHWPNMKFIPTPRIAPSKIEHPIYVDSYVESGSLDPLRKWSSLSYMRSNTVTDRDGYSTPYGDYGQDDSEDPPEDPPVGLSPYGQRIRAARSELGNLLGYRRVEDADYVTESASTEDLDTDEFIIGSVESTTEED